MFRARGFYTSNGYISVLPDGSRIIFATYDEYLDYIPMTTKTLWVSLSLIVKGSTA